MADLVLVDNDERIVELVAWFLRRARHTVRTAASYARVRELLSERRPDLMLADLELGGERGEEELPRLAADGLLPPTLVVSGYLDRGLEQTLRRVPGIRGTLAKPFDLTLLERSIAECLAAPAAEEREPRGDTGEPGWIEIEAGDQGPAAVPPWAPGAGGPPTPGGDWIVLEPELP